MNYDGWGSGTPRDMSSYVEARNIAQNVNAEVGYEAIKVIPKRKMIQYTVYYSAGLGDGNMYPAGEGTASGEVVCGFDVA